MSALFLLAALACSGKDDLPDPPDADSAAEEATGDGDGDGSGGDDTSSPTDSDTPAPELDCEETGMVSGVTAEVTEKVNTVVRVRWTTAEPQVSQVLFGDTPDYGMATELETEPTTEHVALLRGLKANTRFNYRVVVDDGAVHCSDDATVETAGLPSSLPEVSLEVDEASAVGGYTAVPIVAGDVTSTTITIFDEDGDYVWYYEFDGGLAMRATVSLDRQWVLFNYVPQSPDDQGAIYRVSWDAETIERIEATDMHNDFVELPEGNRFASLQWETREYKDAGGPRQIVGSRIIEVDFDGGYDIVWSTFDGLEPDLSRTYPPLLASDELEDWTHLNYLHYDEDKDAYLTPSFHESMVMSVDRGTGSLNWTLGDEGRDYELQDDVRLAFPHSVVSVGDKVMVFDHGEATECSRASLLSLDEGAGTATEEWTYESEDCLLVYFMGAASVLPNDHYLITWSTSGQLDEITPDGDLVWRMGMSIGSAFAFAAHVEGLYP